MKKHNIFRKELEEVLARLDRQNIKNSQQLQAQEQLTLVLWQAVENFVNCCALRSKTHLARDGQIQQGNADRLDELKKRGWTLRMSSGSVWSTFLKIWIWFSKSLWKSSAITSSPLSITRWWMSTAVIFLC